MAKGAGESDNENLGEESRWKQDGVHQGRTLSPTIKADAFVGCWHSQAPHFALYRSGERGADPLVVFTETPG
jgi:hypothetical protein